MSFSLSLFAVGCFVLIFDGVGDRGLVMVCRRIAKMAWYTTSDVKHGNSPFSHRLEVIAIGDKEE
jgi:hypothetical protein